MPEFVVDPIPEGSLFDEPFVLGFPWSDERFNLLHRGNPPDEDQTNPETKPLSYFRELVLEQIVPDERDAARAMITEALNSEPPKIGLTELATAFSWITAERAAAEKKALEKAKVAKRPTGARSRSGPSAN